MKKFIFVYLFLILFINPSFSITEEELTEPKSPAYRLGVTYDLEREYKLTDLTQSQKEKTASYAKEYIRNSTYADSSLKDLSNEISSNYS